MGDPGKLPLALSSTSAVPFYRQIVDQLRVLVHSGALAADDRLPSVREAARDLLVSLITVRRAYADLEAEGLIVQLQGQGTFVAKRRGTAARNAAREEAKIAAAEAIRRALQLGVTGEEMGEMVAALVEEKVSES
jgi:GntR family transcriptional regulator